VSLPGATALAEFGNGFAMGCPAYTQHRFGQGCSFYLGTHLRHNGLAWAIKTPIRVNIAGRDLLTQATIEGTVTIAGYGILIVEQNFNN
jgi:hypothetical protein